MQTFIVGVGKISHDEVFLSLPTLPAQFRDVVWSAGCAKELDHEIKNYLSGIITTVVIHYIFITIFYGGEVKKEGHQASDHSSSLGFNKI